MNNIINFAQEADTFGMISIAAVEESVEGDAVDLRNYAGALAFILQASAGTDDHTVTAKVQTCDTEDGTFEDVVAFAEVTDTASLQKIVVNGDSIARYVRVALDVGGTDPSYMVAVTMLANKG